MINANQTFLLRFLYSSVWKNVGITKDGIILTFLNAINITFVLAYAGLCYQVSCLIVSTSQRFLLIFYRIH